MKCFPSQIDRVANDDCTKGDQNQSKKISHEVTNMCQHQPHIGEKDWDCGKLFKYEALRHLKSFRHLAGKKPANYM
ncbi:hypothetical protein BCEN4_1320033 [Burkholderia cenocepacia]|nr:hypothetical protein BCEN4_1320033 [Burkholderia cenocepacia]